MRKRLGIPVPRARRGYPNSATRFAVAATLLVMVFGVATPVTGAQEIPENLETCGYLNVVLTASGSVAADAAKSLKAAAGSDLDSDEVAALDALVESGSSLEGDGKAKLQARNDESCEDLDVCPLLTIIDDGDATAMSKAALVLRDLSQPVPPSVALAFRDLIDADEADAPFESQRKRVREYFADANCSGATTTTGNDSTDSDSAGTDSGTTGSGGTGTNGSGSGSTTTDTASDTASGNSSGTTGSTTASSTPTPADASAVADMAEHALSGSPTATPVPSTTTAPVTATATASTADALPNTGLGTQALYFSFAAAALVAAGAWLLAVPGVRR